MYVIVFQLLYQGAVPLKAFIGDAREEDSIQSPKKRPSSHIGDKQRQITGAPLEGGEN